MATQFPFPGMPAHVTAHIPLPAFSGVGPGYFVQSQPKMTTAMVFELIVPVLDLYEILFMSKCASAFSIPGILAWWFYGRQMVLLSGLILALS